LANPFYPRFWPERLKELPRIEPWSSKGERKRTVRRNSTKSKGIFVCNMCEFFGDWLPTKWQREVLNVVKNNPQHRFYFLTKKPQNVPNFSPFPNNCWIGVTVSNNLMSANAWKCYFDTFAAKVKFISFEPLLEEMVGFYYSNILKSDWVIIGSQTKPYKPPKIEWVEAIVERADKAGVPVFLKDNLKPLLGDNLRQEFPKC